jgi:hypothetical protein
VTVTSEIKLKKEEIVMRRPIVVVFFAFFAVVCSAPLLRAQIMHQVVATIPHKFVVANTTLPSGKYEFRMLRDTDLTVMTCTNAAGDTEVEFLVDQAEAPKTPQSTELIFNRYGNEEILRRIFEAGDKWGVAVAEPSRQELREEQKGHHPYEHSEPAEKE